MLTGTRPLLLAETFGSTIQGEGPSCGQQAAFIRLSRCNLSCPGCDTPYTWDWTRYSVVAETQRRSAAELIGWALAQPAELIVVTGGEPLMQQDLLVPVVTALTGAGRRVEVETNGTIVPNAAMVAAVSGWNVSPKLNSFAALSDAERRINPDALVSLAATGRAVFKFVASGLDDLDEIDGLRLRFGLAPIWVMPEGRTPEAVSATMRLLADAVIGRGWNLTPRLHVLLWGDSRGR